MYNSGEEYQPITWADLQRICKQVREDGMVDANVSNCAQNDCAGVHSLLQSYENLSLREDVLFWDNNTLFSDAIYLEDDQKDFNGPIWDKPLQEELELPIALDHFSCVQVEFDPQNQDQEVGKSFMTHSSLVSTNNFISVISSSEVIHPMEVKTEHEDIPRVEEDGEIRDMDLGDLRDLKESTQGLEVLLGETETLSSNHSPEPREQRSNIFHMMCHIQGQLFLAMVDSCSSSNVVAERVVELMYGAP